MQPFLPTDSESVDSLASDVANVNLSQKSLTQSGSLNTSLTSLESSEVFATLPNPPPLMPNALGFYGPYLMYNSIDYTASLFYGSCMIVSPAPSPPSLTVINPLDPNETFLFDKPTLLDSFENTLHFYRYAITVPLSTGASPKKYDYFFNNERQFAYSFYVASVNDPSWNWAFHSCNGWSSGVPLETREKMGGLAPLWRDLLTKHAEKPFLLLAGGGDQVYADPVWKLSCLDAWLKTRGRDNRLNAPWTPEMEAEVSKFYLELYLRHFGQSVISEALASIPSINCIDDHDLWYESFTCISWLTV